MNKVSRLFDDKNRVVKWPKKTTEKIAVLQHLFKRFDSNKKYTEKEINYILDMSHTFNDRALLRRALIDQGFMDREKDGSLYWINQNADHVWEYKIISK